MGAEIVGFEPTVPVKVHTLSKRAPSASRTSLRSTHEYTPRTLKNQTKIDRPLTSGELAIDFFNYGTRLTAIPFMLTETVSGERKGT